MSIQVFGLILSPASLETSFNFTYQTEIIYCIGFTLHHIYSYIPTTVGSRSTNTARGTCLPAPVSLKKVLKESSPPPMVLSLGICPSGWMPCSRQYSSQHALPICTPACPTWIEIHSRCGEKDGIETSNEFTVLREA